MPEQPLVPEVLKRAGFPGCCAIEILHNFAGFHESGDIEALYAEHDRQGVLAFGHKVCPLILATTVPEQRMNFEMVQSGFRKLLDFEGFIDKVHPGRIITLWAKIQPNKHVIGERRGQD